MGKKLIGYSNEKRHIFYVKAAAPGENWDAEYAANYPVIYSCETNNLTKDGSFYVISDGVRFRVKDGKAAVTVQFCQPSDWERSLTIPDTLTVDGTEYPVTAVDDYALYNLYFGELIATRPRPLILGKNIETIGDYAFYDCNIKVLDFNGTQKLTSIGEYAFYGLEVASIIFPASLQKIGRHAFAESMVYEATFNSGVVYIGSQAFNNSNLKKATFRVTTGWKIGGRSIDKEIMADPTNRTLIRYLENELDGLTREP